MIKNLYFIRDVSLLFLAVTIIFYPGCNKGKEKYGMRAKDVVTVRDTAKPAMPPLKIVFSTEHIKSVHILSELKDKFGDTGMREILALNRRDTRDIVIGDSICVPDTLPDNFLFFSPFPKKLAVLDLVPKILIFSYPVQAFAAYGNGTLLRWGPTSMGKRTTPTPIGLYSTNWKAKETVSTINEEWILPWAFNIDNFNGISIHEFELPGYPASHSCARLLKSDAEWIYYWADQWILTKDGDSIKAYGTPVIVYGKYDYHSPPPWKLLSENPDADKINEAELVTVIKNYLPTIIRRKNRRDSLLASLRVDTLALSGNHNLN